MNPYRSRTSNSAINRIAVAFVVLIALGAILASILLGPKPNATVVLMQPIRVDNTTERLADRYSALERPPRERAHRSTARDSESARPTDDL
jgi:hypothetical protein